MISICLKSSNINLLNSLEQLLDKVSFERIYYSQRKFKIYNNLIIHYLGNDVNEFYNIFSDLISSFTINHFEKKFIQQQLNFDYFFYNLQLHQMEQFLLQFFEPLIQHQT